MIIRSRTKFFAMLIAILLFFSITLTACGDKPCTHNKTETISVTQATHTQIGVNKIICVDCGAIIDTETIKDPHYEQTNDECNLYQFTNVVDNNNKENFKSSYASLDFEEGWFSLTPNGNNQYPRLTLNLDSNLLAGHTYLIACTLKYDLKDVTATSFSARIKSGSFKQTCGFSLNNLTGARYFSTNRCASLFECHEPIDNVSIEFIMGYHWASDSLGTSFAIKNINFIDVTHVDEIPSAYHLGNLILSQHDGLIQGTTNVNIKNEILYPLQNHNILFLGDSIFGNTKIIEYVHEISKANCINGAIGGTTAVNKTNESLVNLSTAIKTNDWSNYEQSNKSAVNTLKSLDFNTIDVIVIEIGTNDWRRNAPIGSSDSTDTSTFMGALNTILDNILSIYPEIDIYLLTPLFRTEFNADTSPNDNGTFLYEYPEAMKKIAKKYHLPCYDLYNEGGINKYNSNKYLSDGTHPTPIMQIKIAKVINNMIVL